MQSNQQDQTPDQSPNLDQNATNLDATSQALDEQNRQGWQLSQEQVERNERGLPGGGVGRTDTPGRTGIYPISADEGASDDAPVEGEEAFGQGARGAAGYQDSGDSGIIPPDELGKSDKEAM
jgi:hypothetical protein